jgi:rhamnosyltransferase
LAYPQSFLIQALIIPLYGILPSDFRDYVQALMDDGFLVVLVDNQPRPDHGSIADLPAAARIINRNRGGVAGGFNRGVERALSLGANVITLLDQDSRLTAHQLRHLASDLLRFGQERVVIGPWVVDQRRDKPKPPITPSLCRTRMLISSGSTFRADAWNELGKMHEPLEIDYVDHYWTFSAVKNGFHCYQQPAVVLRQVFGERHPSRLCHWLGMQLYSPSRHYTAIRNLRWLIRQDCVPLDVKIKEVIRMAFKPMLWILFEPAKRQNIRAVISGFRDSLPVIREGL